MKLSYLLYQNTEVMNATAECAAFLLPESWLNQSADLQYTDSYYPHLFGRVLLFQQLTNLGYAYHNLPEMQYSQTGKPFFNEDLYFDISYSNGIIMTAVSTVQDLGLATEEFRPISWGALDKYFTNREWVHIKNTNLSSRRLVHAWLSKEALLKLQNNALSIPINNLSYNEKTIELNDQSFFNNSIRLPARFMAQLVTKYPISNMEVQNITPQIQNILKVVA